MKAFLKEHFVSFLILSFSGLIVFALITAGDLEFKWLSNVDLYRLQANGWASGHLDMRDSFGVSVNKRFIDSSFMDVSDYIYDSANFKRKSYCYYGFLPTVIHLIFNNYLNLNITTHGQIFFVGLLSIFICYLIFFDSSRFVLSLNPQDSKRIALLGVLSITSSYVFLHTLSIGFSSFQSVVTSAFFLLLATFLFQKWFLGLAQIKILFWAGSCLGFAFLSRHNSLIFWPGLYLIMILTLRKDTLRSLIKHSVIFGAPMLVALILMLAYQKLIYDDPFETGFMWVNATFDFKNYWGVPTLSHVIQNFQNYFLSKVEFNSHFTLPLLKPINHVGTYSHNYPVLNFLIGFPILIGGLLSFFASVFNRKWTKTLLISAYFLLPLPLFFFSMMSESAWIRYLYDIVFFWTFPSVLFFFEFSSNKWKSRVGIFLMLMVLLIGIERTLSLHLVSANYNQPQMVFSKFWQVYGKWRF